MATVLLLLHYIVLVGVSIYVVFYGWNNIHGINGKITSSSSEIKTVGDIVIKNDYLQKVCTVLNGCDVIKGENLCQKYLQDCHGSERCCSDCHFRWLTNLNISLLFGIMTDKASSNSTTTPTSVTFADKYYLIIKTNIIISAFIILLYIIFFIMITVYKNTKDKNTKDKLNTSSIQKQSKFNKSFRMLRGVVSILFLITFIISIGNTIYNTMYFIVNVYQLLQCQPSFVLILTWNMILLLHILDQITHISHITKGSYNIMCGINCFLHYIISIGSFLIILWWICTGIYFYGVYTNKWFIQLTQQLVFH